MTRLFDPYKCITRPTNTVILLGFILLIFLFGNMSGIAWAQSPIMAEVDRTILSTREQLTLTVTVTGDFLNIPNPDLSLLTDFVVVSSSTSTQVSIINGELTSQGIFVYLLQPLKEGGLVVAPVTVNIEGQIYQTEPINIRVITSTGPTPATPPANPVPDTLQGQDFFVEAEVDNPSPYLGQQIIYTFRLYQATTFIGQPDYQPPAFTDFWSQTLSTQPHYNTTAGGRDYLVTEIRTALFPANLGSITIAPAKIVIPGFPYQDIVLETDPLEINVQSLPEGAPPDFKGAVGDFKIQAQLSEIEGVVNEPLTLFVEIEGAGNIEVLVEPVLPEIPNWRVFDSQPSTRIEAQGDIIYGTRRFERLIVPGQPGNYTLPAISFSYYDPEAGEYHTISTEPIPITIHPGEVEASPPIAITEADKQQVELIADDIRHIKPVPSSLASEGSPIWNQPLYWSCWVLPVLAVGGIWLWQNRRQRWLADVGYARSQRARRAAQKILAGANAPGVDSYAAAHRALLSYLSDKLNRPTVGLTTDNLIQLLGEGRLDPALVERVRSTLMEIEVSRFAPVGEAAAQELVSETRKLINDLEKSFK